MQIGPSFFEQVSLLRIPVNASEHPTELCPQKKPLACGKLVSNKIAEIYFKLVMLISEVMCVEAMKNKWSATVGLNLEVPNAYLLQVSSISSSCAFLFKVPEPAWFFSWSTLSEGVDNPGLEWWQHPACCFQVGGFVQSVAPPISLTRSQGSCSVYWLHHVQEMLNYDHLRMQNLVSLSLSSLLCSGSWHQKSCFRSVEE